MLQHLNPIDLVQRHGRMAESISGTMRSCLFFWGLIVLLFLERIRPLRLLTQPKLKRIVRNLSFAGANAILLNLTLLPLVYWAARLSTRKHYGLLHAVPLPKGVAVLSGLLLMDYTFYWWHYWNHMNSSLWCFHNVHHIDLDLDVTTAARFISANFCFPRFTGPRN